jgi:hydroxypyruvate isomerase
MRGRRSLRQGWEDIREVSLMLPEGRAFFSEPTGSGMKDIGIITTPGVRLLYDLYHSVVMDEDPAEVLPGADTSPCMLQIADHPGPHEPGSGGVDWKREISKQTKVP